MASQICSISGTSFGIGDKERGFYQRFNLPLPKTSPIERRRRRLARRNERFLYHRTCDASGQRVLSMYPEATEFPVYNKEYWWSDNWDPTAYGRDFDFNRTFFEQFADLQSSVPRPAINIVSNENCEFVNQCGYSKDCYLSFNTDYSQGCFYCNNTLRSVDCVDCLNIEHCELCYESVDCVGCYSGSFLRDCANCTDCHFMKNCVGCSNCIGCVNLRNKQYYYFQKKVSRDDYFRLLAEHKLGRHREREALLSQHVTLIDSAVLPHAELIRVEGSLGNYLRDCQSAYHCFDSFDDRDVFHSTVLSAARDVSDFDIGGYDAETCYEVVSSGDRLRNCFWCSNLWGRTSDVAYCDIVFHLSDCFGCIGLRDAEFCILNKRYSEQAYLTLRDRIVKHMQSTGEYGEFFPTSISLFPYNHSVAQEIEPLSRTEAIRRGLKWEERPTTVLTDSAEVPDDIDQIDDGVGAQVFTCVETGKPYRLQKAELTFYRKQGLAAPRISPDERHRRRRQERNPYRLWKGSCCRCKKELCTSFDPKLRASIACEQCYPQFVH